MSETVDEQPIQKYDYNVGKIVASVDNGAIVFEDGASIAVPSGVDVSDIPGFTLLEVGPAEVDTHGYAITKMLNFGHAVEGGDPVIVASVELVAEPEVDYETPPEPSNALPES